MNSNLENFQDISKQLEKIKNSTFYSNLFSMLNKSKLIDLDFDMKGHALMSFGDEFLSCIFKNLEFENSRKPLVFPDYIFLFTVLCTQENYELLEYASLNEIPVIITEDGFLKSADTNANQKAPLKYRQGISYTFETKAPYFDANRSSRLELMLNDENLNFSSDQILRAKRLIKKIVDSRLTKYNHQPIYTPSIGRNGVKKVLVVDQSATDMSVVLGRLNEFSFKKMLKTAIADNPDADIIVKIHPDVLAKKRQGFFGNLKEHDNVYIQSEAINPISLIQYVDKVYVGSSQLGFEALMCGKEVHVFGVPFYAGWGLTVDYMTCSRRTRKRSLEEIFYIAYILYTAYVDPIKKKKIEIEEAIEFLLSLREEYTAYRQGHSDIKDYNEEEKYYLILKKEIEKHNSKQIILWGNSNFLSNFLDRYKNELQIAIDIVDGSEKATNSENHGIKIHSLDYLDEIGNCYLISTLYNNHSIRYEYIKKYLTCCLNSEIELAEDIFDE